MRIPLMLAALVVAGVAWGGLHIAVVAKSTPGSVVDLEVIPETPPGWTPQDPGESTYVVERGDTLWGIARAQLGQGRLWEALYAANRDRISDPDRVPEGLVLRLPERG